ncbi:MAG TPA: pyridoxamine 5'-phosphate oxidase family protein [Anaerolineales bacterium]|nr:pyridoxamine 5'-phosphate oxidase family protein [Anaerolineales bacterium]
MSDAAEAPAGWRAGRPAMPSGYGIDPPRDSSYIPWKQIVNRLERARNYWVVSASAHRGPHAMPVWGLWADDRFVFSTDPASQKARNLTADARVVVHLESGDEVVVVEGRAEQALESGRLESWGQIYQAKYGVPLGDGPVFQVTPDRIFAWEEAHFPSSATKWERSGRAQGRRA